jgi:TRAP-type C4-dicarboxylate transport system permease small subunit
VLDAIDLLGQRMTQLLMLAIICVLAAQVFFRFMLNASLTWSEEVAGWCMVWVVFIGAVSLVRHDAAVSIPIFVTMLPRKWRAAAVIVSRVATIVAALFLAWYGARVVAGTFHIVSQTTGVNTRYIKLCVPISAALMALFALLNLAADIRRLARDGARAVPVPGAPRPEQPPIAGTSTGI